MRYKKTVLFLILFIFVAGMVLANSKIRVTSEKANIRVRPTTQSAIITTVPLGAMLDVIKKQGDWFLIKLPPDKNGIPITGYVHQSIVEIIEETKQLEAEEVEPKKEIATEEKTIAVERKQEKLVKIKPETIMLQKKTTDLDYQEWKAEYNKAELTFVKWKKYATIGMLTSLGCAGLGVPLVAVLARENYLVPAGVMLTASVGGTILWLYAASKRGDAAEKMALLLNRGKIKGWIGASFDPKRKMYTLSFTISF